MQTKQLISIKSWHNFSNSIVIITLPLFPVPKNRLKIPSKNFFSNGAKNTLTHNLWRWRFVGLPKKFIASTWRWFREQRTRFISGSGSIRNARVDRFPIGFPPRPPIRAVARGSRASNTGACVILKVRHRRIPFHSVASSIHRFCKISVRPVITTGRELLRGRPIDGGRRTREEGFNNGEEGFFVLRVRVATIDWFIILWLESYFNFSFSLFGVVRIYCFQYSIYFAILSSFFKWHYG